MTMISLETLLGRPKAEEVSKVVEIPGIGMIKVKAWSFLRHREMQKAANESGEFDQARWYALLLSEGLADPAVTYDQAMLILQQPSGYLDAILSEVLQIAGLLPGGEIDAKAVDAAEASFCEGSEQVPPVPPS